MTRRLAQLRGLVDWRLVVAIAGLLMLLLLGYTVVDAAQSRGRAFDALDDVLAAQDVERVEAAHERGRLHAQIDVQQIQLQQLLAMSNRNGRRVARLVANIRALQRQLQQAGIEPIVPPDRRPTTQPPPSDGSAGRPDRPRDAERGPPRNQPRPRDPRPDPPRRPPDRPPDRPLIGCIPVIDVCASDPQRPPALPGRGRSPFFWACGNARSNHADTGMMGRMGGDPDFPRAALQRRRAGGMHRRPALPPHPSPAQHDVTRAARIERDLAQADTTIVTLEPLLRQIRQLCDVDDAAAAGPLVDECLRLVGSPVAQPSGGATLRSRRP